jgi:hypothetical protein
MGLAIDTTRAVRGPRARLELVGALLAAPPSEPETDWIEWKGEADLKAKAWRGELASHVLGFANRDPLLAARNFEGHAYLLVGVQPGRLGGVEALDPAQLDDGVAPYLGGAEGPRWELDFLQLDGRTVLAITVDAPREGDPIHTLRRGFTNPSGKTQPEGRIFIRRQGQTTPEPSSAEVRMLSARSRPAAPGLDLEITCLEEEITPLDRGEEAQRHRIAAAGRPLLEVAPESGGELEPWPRVQVFLSETRTPEAYREEIFRYLRELELVYGPLALAEGIERGIGRLRLVVGNHSAENFAGLQVELVIEGEASAWFGAEEVRAQFQMPDRPRAWEESLLKGLEREVERLSFPPRDGRRVENSGPPRVRYPAFDLRPVARDELPAIYVAVDPARAGEDLAVAWTATSTSAPGLASGRLTVPIAGGS